VERTRVRAPNDRFLFFQLPAQSVSLQPRVPYARKNVLASGRVYCTDKTKRRTRLDEVERTASSATPPDISYLNHMTSSSPALGCLPDVHSPTLRPMHPPGRTSAYTGGRSSSSHPSRAPLAFFNCGGCASISAPPDRVSCPTSSVKGGR